MFKRLIALGIIAAMFAVVLLQGARASNAAGVCVATVVGTAAVTVIAANDQGSYGRKFLLMQNATAPTAAPAVIWCNIGATAASGSGIMLQGAGATTAAPLIQIPATQQAAKTYPIVPSGAVSCYASAASQNITVCDY